MPNVLAACAAAVTDALNDATAGTFSQDFAAIRSYADWELPLEESAEADAVFVDVVPVPQLESELETRGSLSYSPAVDVVVRKKLGPEKRDMNGRYALAEIDALVLFVQELAEFFVIDQFASGERWKQTDIRRAFVPHHLYENHQFTGQIRVTFETSKAT